MHDAQCTMHDAQCTMHDAQCMQEPVHSAILSGGVHVAGVHSALRSLCDAF
jgi:hypothetical protein